MDEFKQPTTPPRITFERLSPNCYDVFYDKQVKFGQIATRGRSWNFFPEDCDSVSVPTMKALIEKIEWLDARITSKEF